MTSKSIFLIEEIAKTSTAYYIYYFLSNANSYNSGYLFSHDFLIFLFTILSSIGSISLYLAFRAL